jgi:hypothetical protein
MSVEGKERRSKSVVCLSVRICKRNIKPINSKVRASSQANEFFYTESSKRMDGI